MRTVVISIITMLCVSVGVYAQQTQEALDYMNTIGESIDDTKNETWSYLKAATRGRSARTLERRRQDLIEEIGDVLDEINELGDFYGDDSYRREVINYLTLTRIVMREDFAQIMDLEEIAERSYDNMEAYLLAQKVASEKLDSAFSIYQAAQNSFASNNNITLIEGEQSRRDKKIAKAAKALAYYNRVFLVHFKTSVQEMYVIEAMNRGDIVSLEQSIEALKEAATEGLEMLDTFSSYQNDAILINACRRSLMFYQREAEVDFPKFVDFFIAKDNFDQMHERMESVSERDRTEEDIDNYNEAVEEYNAIVPVFNGTIEKTNEKRDEMNKNWEDQVEDFFDEYA